MDRTEMTLINQAYQVMNRGEMNIVSSIAGDVCVFVFGSVWIGV